MAKLGSDKRPLVLRVQSIERVEAIASLCENNGWKYAIGIEPDKHEDLSDIDKVQNPGRGMRVEATPGRNDPCPCGSGLKLKKCCMNKG